MMLIVFCLGCECDCRRQRRGKCEGEQGLPLVHGYPFPNPGHPYRAASGRSLIQINRKMRLVRTIRPPARGGRIASLRIS